MPASLAERLEARARAAGVDLQSALRDRLLAYYELLSKWNRTINLTSLSDPDAAIDRLLLEPLLAARVLPQPAAMMDLGSGGGSPAIPLALALDSPHLVMVESRGRKAAFLREAAREVGLHATVEAARFEDLVGRPDYRSAMDLVSMRAVRMDAATLDIAREFAKPGGSLALFTSESPVDGEVTPLLGRANLIRLIVPRGTPGQG
jgi:16S rRNA (guanine527-N7)-methyltransferase